MGYVYFIQCDVFFKIGHTSNKVKKRVSAIQTSSPYKVYQICSFKFDTLEEAVDFESKMHKTFHRERIRGEWFKLSHNQIDTVKIVYADNLFEEHEYPEVILFPKDGTSETLFYRNLYKQSERIFNQYKYEINHKINGLNAKLRALKRKNSKIKTLEKQIELLTSSLERATITTQVSNLDDVVNYLTQLKATPKNEKNI